MRLARTTLPGHPDKASDLVAEAIVDEYLRRDPATRIALNVAGGHGALFISGDVSSEADFDVASLVRRTLGSLGVMDEMEPFVSIENVVAEQLPLFASGFELPVIATGYASSETPELIPSIMLSAKRIAKALEERRQHDADWFWLGADAEVAVQDNGREPMDVRIFLEHGAKPLVEVRKSVESAVHSILSDARVHVNELGAHEIRGLAHRSGASGKDRMPYGSLLPSVSSGIGRDIRHAEKAGSWLMRSAARKLVQNGAKAALVQATYVPGELVPSRVTARDERGTDLSSKIDRASLSLERIAKEWWRPGLNADAARWGFAGESGLPWETDTSPA